MKLWQKIQSMAKDILGTKVWIEVGKFFEPIWFDGTGKVPTQKDRDAEREHALRMKEKRGWEVREIECPYDPRRRWVMISEFSLSDYVAYIDGMIAVAGGNCESPISIVAKRLKEIDPKGIAGGDTERKEIARKNLIKKMFKRVDSYYQKQQGPIGINQIISLDLEFEKDRKKKAMTAKVDAKVEEIALGYQERLEDDVDEYKDLRKKYVEEEDDEDDI